MQIRSDDDCLCWLQLGYIFAMREMQSAQKHTENLNLSLGKKNEMKTNQKTQRKKNKSKKKSKTLCVCVRKSGQKEAKSTEVMPILF